MEEQKLFENEFDRQYGDSYRNECSNATRPDHVLPGNTEAETNGKSLTPKPSQTGNQETARELAAQLKPKEHEPELNVFGYSVVDFVNAMLPQGAPEGSRHKFALKVATDAIILFDGDMERVRSLLLALPWVQEIVTERGLAEIDSPSGIIATAKKRMEKREAENLNDPQPSKDMRRAIEQVTGSKYSELLREEHGRVMGKAVAAQADILQVLQRVGNEFKKFIPKYPLLSLLCFRLKPKYFPAVFFVGGSFAMTLMTRCWYQFWPKPGKHNRLNSLVLLIGRMGGMKSVAVDLYDMLMEPVKMADAAQIAALNKYNAEREQNNGGAKNKTPRPQGIYRALPPETSTAALREAEANAHETIDGDEVYLHVSVFDSELQNTLSQMKKGYMDALQTYWLKSFHAEKHGAYLKTSNAPIGETEVHFSAVYTGTDVAMRALNTEKTCVNGLMSRFTAVPNADSNFEMLEVHDYDDAARKRDDDLKEWAYRLDGCKGEIPCKLISDALKAWTARRMADAGEDQDLAQEDLVKRPCWHAINFVLPFVVTRHWDKMVQDEDGRWICGPDFKVDQTDVRLALLIANTQLAFQEHFCKGILEKHYDDLAAERASNVRHQQKTLLAYRRLPAVFTRDEVMTAYSYTSIGSADSRIKRLQDDGLILRIRSGADKGKYRKLA